MSQRRFPMRTPQRARKTAVLAQVADVPMVPVEALRIERMGLAEPAH
jgi:hypothetical protein